MKDFQQKYFQKAKLAAAFLQLTPFIRMIGLNGSVARGQAHQKSDIDFIIISKPGRVWTCRAFSFVLMAILGLKRYQNKIAGRVCLNLYHTEDKMFLTCHTKELAQNHAQTLPLWQQRKQFLDFAAQNQWVSEFGEKFQNLPYEPNLTETYLSFILTFFRTLAEFIFELIFSDWGEAELRKYQEKRIGRDLRTIRSTKGEIFISDYELRFHPAKTKLLTK